MSDYTLLTEADLAMLEMATRRGVLYMDYDPATYDDEEEQ